MRPIHLLTVANGNGSGQAEPALATLEQLAVGISRIFRTRCSVKPGALDSAFAFDERRRQYHSTAILQKLEKAAEPDVRVLGVTACDLYVPVLTFVFGEAQLEGSSAVVSMARLKDEFYGLPPRPDLLHERLLKEAVHELGHTFGLRHCSDWQCVMSSSHAVERLDIKSVEFCAACRKAVLGFYW